MTLQPTASFPCNPHDNPRRIAHQVPCNSLPDGISRTSQTSLPQPPRSGTLNGFGVSISLLSSETRLRSKMFRDMSHDSISGQDRKFLNGKHNVQATRSEPPVEYSFSTHLSSSFGRYCQLGLELVEVVRREVAPYVTRFPEEGSL